MRAKTILGEELEAQAPSAGNQTFAERHVGHMEVQVVEDFPENPARETAQKNQLENTIAYQTSSATREKTAQSHAVRLICRIRANLLTFFVIESRALKLHMYIILMYFFFALRAAYMILYNMY